MKVIFLDVDGVLIHDNYKNKETCHVDEEKIKIIKKIVEETNSKIVITSTWRHPYIDGTDINQPEYDLLIKMLKSHNIEIYDKTPVHKLKLLSNHEYEILKNEINSRFHPLTTRAGEIYTWLKDKEIESFLILDDDESEWEYFGLEKNLIETSKKYGITEKAIEKAINILNNEKTKTR